MYLPCTCRVPALMYSHHPHVEGGCEGAAVYLPCTPSVHAPVPTQSYAPRRCCSTRTAWTTIHSSSTTPTELGQATMVYAFSEENLPHFKFLRGNGHDIMHTTYLGRVILTLTLTLTPNPNLNPPTSAGRTAARPCAVTTAPAHADAVSRVCSPPNMEYPP